MTAGTEQRASGYYRAGTTVKVKRLGCVALVSVRYELSKTAASVANDRAASGVRPRAVTARPDTSGADVIVRSDS
ncbi:hypothetical protein M2251_002821 [Rhodococcus erythropolis]|nr:hypothetical protein [Rhodococcus erythropolis]